MVKNTVEEARLTKAIRSKSSSMLFFIIGAIHNEYFLEKATC